MTRLHMSLIESATWDVEHETTFEHEGVCAKGDASGEWCPSCRAIALDNLRDASATVEHKDWCCVGMHPPECDLTCCTCGAAA